VRRSEPQFSWAIGPLNSAGRLAHATSGCPIRSRSVRLSGRRYGLQSPILCLSIPDLPK